MSRLVQGVVHGTLEAACILALACAPGCGGARDAGSGAGPDTGAALQSLVEDYVLFTGETNAALAVDAPGLRDWLGVAGVTDLQSAKPLPDDVAFRGGSTTKALVAATVFSLVDDGRLGVDDTLGKWVDGYPAWSSITIRQLLGMQSGIPDYLMDQVLWLSVVLDPDKPLAPQDVLATVADDPMEFEPGTACRYSNTNYILLGLVIEAASGQPAHEEIRDRVVIPLGLEHTYLDVEGKEDFRLAHGYMDPRMAFMELDVSPDLIALIPRDLLAEEGLVDCTYLSHPSISWTAGALVTTPRDMTRMVRSLVGGALASGEMLAQRMDSGPCEIVAETSDYGLGLMAWDTPLGRAFGHGGLMYGYSGKTGFVEEADVAYSYAVGSYPAQEELLVDEALSLLAAPGSMEIPAACRPPDGMLEPAADTDRLSLRFRGRLGSQEEDAAPGMANLTAYLGQSRYLLHGKGTRALLVAGSEGLADTVQVDSYGPPRTGKSHASRCLLTLSAALWDDDPDAHTLDLPEAAAPADAWLWDVWEDPESAQPVRECVVAVRDTTKPSHLYRCDPGMPAEAGRLLRLYGSFVLTQEPAALQSALARTGAPQCRCLADGAWDECP